MKKIKLLPSVLMLALCIGILGIGIYAANPTNNVISGTITVTAANAGIKVEVFEGQDTTGTRLGYAEGRTTTTIPIGEVEIDASNALTLEDVPTKYYTIKFSTTSTYKFIVDTETVQLIDGEVTETQETKEDAIIITKNHKKYLEDTESGLEYFTADIKDGETITTDNSYLITIAIRLGELPEQAFGATLNMQFDVHKLTDWVEAGNTGINGIDYLHYGEYPQTLAATSLDGYTKLQDANSEYVTFAAYDDAGGETTRAVYTKDGETDGSKYVLLESITEWGWDESQYISSWTTTGTYLYKIEPLRWDILSRNSTTGEAMLKCSTIIEQVKYYENTSNRTIDGQTIYPNNYKESSLRKFLTETFYNSAFNASEQAIMQKYTVKNDLQSTGDTSNSYVTDVTTDDFIFALSKADVTNDEYGFPTTTGMTQNRVMYPSNYASATGAYTYTLEEMLYYASENGFEATREGWIEYAMDTDVGMSMSQEEAESWYEVWQNSGYWWLRSPYSYNAYNVRFVYGYGLVSDLNVSNDFPGCVPALLLGL